MGENDNKSQNRGTQQQLIRTGGKVLVALIGSLTTLLIGGVFVDKNYTKNETVEEDYVPKDASNDSLKQLEQELLQCKAENKLLKGFKGGLSSTQADTETVILQGIQGEILSIKGYSSSQKIEIEVSVTNITEINQNVSVIDVGSEIRSKGRISPAVHAKLANNEVDHFGGVSRSTIPLLIKPDEFLIAVYYFEKIPPSLTIPDEITVQINGNSYSFSNGSIDWE